MKKTTHSCLRANF